MRNLRILDELTTDIDVSDRYVDVLYNGSPEEHEDIADYFVVKGAIV